MIISVLNLGAALAATSAKVLLADLDLQRDLAAYESTLDAPNITFAATEATALPALLRLRRESSLSSLLQGEGKGVRF